MSKGKQVFDDDEMGLRGIESHWTAEDLLNQDGIFFLKDVVKVLGIHSLKVKKHAYKLIETGQEPYRIMGVRKVWTHWIVRMTTFAPYYRENIVSRLSAVDPSWTGNQLLMQKGIFQLNDVCKKLPFSAHQLRYQAKANPNSREEFGTWKDKELNLFLVDMEPFAKWITKLWDRRDGDQKT